MAEAQLARVVMSEPGSSLRASGFPVIGEVRRQRWSRPSRPRRDRHELRRRFCWERTR